MKKSKLKLTINDHGDIYRLQHDPKKLDVSAIEFSGNDILFKKLRTTWYEAASVFYDTGSTKLFRPGKNAPDVFIWLDARELVAFLRMSERMPA